MRGHDPPSGQAPLRVLRAPDLKESNGSLKVKQRIVKMHEHALNLVNELQWNEINKYIINGMWY